MVRLYSSTHSAVYEPPKWLNPLEKHKISKLCQSKCHKSQVFTACLFIYNHFSISWCFCFHNAPLLLCPKARKCVFISTVLALHKIKPDLSLVYIYKCIYTRTTPMEWEIQAIEKLLFLQGNSLMITNVYTYGYVQCHGTLYGMKDIGNCVLYRQTESFPHHYHMNKLNEHFLNVCLICCSATAADR